MYDRDETSQHPLVVICLMESCARRMHIEKRSHCFCSVALAMICVMYMISGVLLNHVSNMKHIHINAANNDMKINGSC